jgi:UDP-glucose 4-epimerase
LKVLVTGGAGFIGSHVVDSLIERGDEVVVVDNLSTGFKENVNPAARFYQLSIGDSKLAELFKRERPDVVSHYAAQMNLRRSVAEPLFDAQENILGSLNVILSSVRFGVKKFVYASSSAVYGEAQYLPADEDHPINPISQYGVSKHTVEHYLYLYAHQCGLDYVILRYPNVYGPRQNPYGEAGVIAIFTRQMLRREHPTIFGQGDKTRDYTHISDVVQSNLLAIERGNNAIYNIGTGVETSVKQIFDILAEALDYKGSPVYAPAREEEVHRMCLNWGKAQRELGWRPKLPLKEGILNAIEFYKAQKSR